MGWAQQQAEIPDIALYKQAAQPVEARVHDFLDRMTVEEKARQLEMYRGDSHLSLLHSSRTGPATLDRCSPRRYNQSVDPRQPLDRNRKTGLGFQVRGL